MYSLKKCTGRRNKSQARTKRLAGASYHIVLVEGSKKKPPFPVYYVAAIGKITLGRSPYPSKNYS
ncbi:hypothetical protein MGG_14909 [Pyricularia oryzae 70-15]|uniref:Uncharacterized protein n=1 Tax=Pyricularia oryzae (strain 70-15 / ATCC MYA-4617 / FGSC 8958) TaxID=242507 RepID=G4NIP3_PYRO7|nr:uncharacterized protein MGG_14909 [Pyricularia oryzae 70-15]EHA47299.1 hypothetical protein MGG_14909 [Pyricularia oryzae 70-15]